MSSQHITNEYLQLLLDGVLIPYERVGAEHHLQSCKQCRQAYQRLAWLDTSLKILPVEKTNADFASVVLAKLNIAPRTSFLFRIVENLAYAFGLVVVLGLMLTAFLVTGVVNKKQVMETQSTFTNFERTIGQQVDSFAGGLTAFMQTYLPFIFGSGTLKIALMSTLAIGTLALVDKFLKRRYHA
jgi:hypothetical protein